MVSEINDLVAMRDVETLYELMTEDEDWMTQLDAAEGLVKLGDRRGYEFIMTATLSDDELTAALRHSTLRQRSCSIVRAKSCTLSSLQLRWQ